MFLAWYISFRPIAVASLPPILNSVGANQYLYRPGFLKSTIFSGRPTLLQTREGESDPERCYPLEALR